MSNRKALETMLIDKENFESYIDDTLAHKLTDAEWEEICDAIEEDVAVSIDSAIEYVAHKYKDEKGIE